LHLANGVNVIRVRQSWFNQFKMGETNLAGLHRRAPLIARAIEGAIFEHVGKQGSINRKQASAVCFIPEACARRSLDELVEPGGRLRKEGRGKGVKYRLP
jgi:hypothetical protein